MTKRSVLTTRTVASLLLVGGLFSASMSVLAEDQAAAAGPPPEGKLSAQ